MLQCRENSPTYSQCCGSSSLVVAQSDHHRSIVSSEAVCNNQSTEYVIATMSRKSRTALHGAFGGRKKARQI